MRKLLGKKRIAANDKFEAVRAKSRDQTETEQAKRGLDELLAQSG